MALNMFEYGDNMSKKLRKVHMKSKEVELVGRDILEQKDGKVDGRRAAKYRKCTEETQYQLDNAAYTVNNIGRLMS
jgi:hypothetical protein